MMDNLEPLNTDGGRTVQVDVHYSAICDETIAVAESLAASGKLSEALDTLLMLEKQTRNVSDVSFYIITTSHFIIYVLLLVIK